MLIGLGMMQMEMKMAVECKAPCMPIQAQHWPWATGSIAGLRGDYWGGVVVDNQSGTRTIDPPSYACSMPNYHAGDRVRPAYASHGIHTTNYVSLNGETA